MVPSTKVFFKEVRAAYAGAAGSLGLTGPAETEHVLPVSTYTGGGVNYEISLDFRGGIVECRASIDRESVTLIADVEDIALAAGIVERRGNISYSARNLKQFSKSLQGQVDCVQRVHHLLADSDVAEDLMRRAHAREWNKRGQRGAQ
ncbi:hypothetical protein [Streptomyces sp900116325]|uniref:hypothetical protein n=1 Tax=Streptomyces sp. 900116325 TaxID=3154295 RepID=UPI0033AEC245